MSITTLPLKLNYPPEIEAFIAEELATGRFASESELAATAIGWVKEQLDHERKFQADLKRSIEQADRGEFAPLDTEATLREARRRLADQ